MSMENSFEISDRALLRSWRTSARPKSGRRRRPDRELLGIFGRIRLRRSNILFKGVSIAINTIPAPKDHDTLDEGKDLVKEGYVQLLQLSERMWRPWRKVKGHEVRS